MKIILKTTVIVKRIKRKKRKLKVENKSVCLTRQRGQGGPIMNKEAAKEGYF